MTSHFQLARGSNYGKCKRLIQGKSILVQVSMRFELPGVWVNGINCMHTDNNTIWVLKAHKYNTLTYSFSLAISLKTNFVTFQWFLINFFSILKSIPYICIVELHLIAVSLIWPSRYKSHLSTTGVGNSLLIFS